MNKQSLSRRSKKPQTVSQFEPNCQVSWTDYHYSNPFRQATLIAFIKPGKDLVHTVVKLGLRYESRAHSLPVSRVPRYLLRDNRGLFTVNAITLNCRGRLLEKPSEEAVRSL